MNDIENFLKNTKAYPNWKKIGFNSHHGVLIPLFALRSEQSSGIGEYFDLFQVIDWLKNIGFDVLQLLPLNETGKDPSPYNAISSCALNTMHLTLHKLPGIDNNTSLKEMLKDFKIFNSYHRIHYAGLKKLKENFLHEYYDYIYDELKKDKEFETFLIENPWLEEYALFRAIQEKQNYKVWDDWPEMEKNPTKQNLPKLVQKYHPDMHFHFAMQYFCFKQLKEVKKYAGEKGILIQGDVPILVSRNSADVWFNRDVFDLTHVAGAPPDNYSIYGQKWGFPLFNWNKLKQNNYYWWKRRLNSIKDLYDIYRIDHVVGFFRIWAMLPDEDAVQGKFLPKDPAYWTKKGREKLEMMLDSSPLLPIAEDLGLIPKTVYRTLDNLGICGSKVVPWETNRFGYIKFSNYPKLSVTMLSTHDSDTFQQWWEGYQKGSTKFAKFMNWHYNIQLSYSQRKELLYNAHHTPSFFHINLLQEYLNLYPELSWPDPDDERINIPGTMLPTNWTYRFKPSFEEILNHKDLEKDLKEILRKKD
ncbi:MAG: 4-alpha-glucanotransferase [Parachlamydiales bacterium]|nr:4-alpha-glucanotransferase [Parachlamydiales bacterium]